MSAPVTVTFQGVRGSTPCEGREYERYGGHSSCVALEVAGETPIVFDLGTGLRPLGVRLGGPVTMHALLTHLHWDHMQGLPFFAPALNGDSVMTIIGPQQHEGSLADVFRGIMRPPYFPITPDVLPADVRFEGVGDDEIAIGQAKVSTRWVRHVGPTLGFRVQWHGVSIAYLPDHGQGCGDTRSDDYVPDGVLELCDGVDLLIHDAQHTTEEFGPKRNWGHCTVDYAVHVAREAGVRTLALFHHDPAHGDDMMDQLTREAEDMAAARGVPDLVAAREGMVLSLAQES
jgi:phosphoribosyl 1,2-cyclic phosphodiesterase